MNTHTIKKRNSINPIISFTKKFINELNKYDTWTKQVIISGLIDDIKRLTGKKCVLDCKTNELLKFECEKIGCDSEPIEFCYIRKWFISGRRGLDCDIEMQLKVVGKLANILKKESENSCKNKIAKAKQD